MGKFRKELMQKAVEFLSTPEQLYEDLLVKLAGLKPRIFVSYSSKDQLFVDELFARLKESGERVWLNTESIPKAARWHDELVSGLRETDLLILVLPEDSIASKWVREEWKTFQKMGKTILPVVHRECKLPRPIHALQVVRTADANWYYKLLKTIQQHL